MSSNIVTLTSARNKKTAQPPTNIRFADLLRLMLYEVTEGNNPLFAYDCANRIPDNIKEMMVTVSPGIAKELEKIPDTDNPMEWLLK